MTSGPYSEEVKALWSAVERLKSPLTYEVGEGDYRSCEGGRESKSGASTAAIAGPFRSALSKGAARLCSGSGPSLLTRRVSFLTIDSDVDDLPASMLANRQGPF